MTQTTIPVVNGAGTPINLRAVQNPDGSFSFQGSQEVGGAPVAPGNPVPVQPMAGAAPYVATPLGYQQLSNLSSSVGFSNIPAGATFCRISVSQQSVRYRDDGIAPTSALGMPLQEGTSDWIYSGSLSAIQFIQVNAGAVIDVAFYK